jgi:N-acetylglucosaminyldiphosphoundecaprenol N-acetyl-beta-D-mannosaminyltransferase
MSETDAIAESGVAPGRSANAPLAQPSIRLLGLDFNARSPAEVLRLIAARPAGAPFAYVASLNADHLVRLSRKPAFRPYYDDAWLRLLDSQVVAHLAYLLGLPVPPVVTFSDLTADLVRHALLTDKTVNILGLTKREAQALARRTALRFAHYSPPARFESDADSLERTLRFVEDNPAHLVFLAVGSPQQEMLARTLAARGVAVGTGLCVGPALRFLAGTEKRAPVMLQRAGLEWVWRLAQNPRRLWRRYLVKNPAILGLLWREARGRC